MRQEKLVILLFSMGAFVHKHNEVFNSLSCICLRVVLFVSILYCASTTYHLGADNTAMYHGNTQY